MNKKAIIIGGGVSGVTTALTLQLLGFETRCYAACLVDRQTPRDPKFASLYPAASIIPHSVQTDELSTLFPTSLDVFKWLQKQNFPAIALHRHYEIFEFPATPPDYTRFLSTYRPITKDDYRKVPHRTDAPDLHGWVFDCFVAKWPLYMHQLYTLYKKAGGTILRQKIQPEIISQLPADLVINCSGIWSARLFEDEAPARLIRGHLLHVPNKKPVLDPNNRPYSYNYTPQSSVYAASDGSPSDVYFYPVNNRWILGGSRQIGSLNEDGKWQGPEYTDTVKVSTQQVPRPILELNEEILKTTYQIGFKKDDAKLKAFAGYRYTRTGKNGGLRLEAARQYNKVIIHNYAHGGAGVSLSWGCALKVLQLIKQETGHNFLTVDTSFHHRILSSLQLQLLKLYLRNFHL